ncbi:MAG: hypothetical protein OHK0056_15500 [Bacteriovoracaceae bacterium]
MNRFSLYILLVMLYLGLSKSLAPAEQKADFIQNEQVFSSYFKGHPITVLLTDIVEAGFLIKTYYLKLRVINPFESYSEDVVVRTSSEFWSKNKDNIGMTIFRRKDEKQSESYLPLPPGAQFIGDPAYGSWEYEDSGRKIWSFHKAYRRLYSEFFWGTYRPDFEFYNELQSYLKNNSIYYGPHKEFGTQGKVTIENLISKNRRTENEISTTRFKDFVKKYWKFPKQFNAIRGNE